MRILSQDGTVDVPYENFVFCITKDNYIVATRDTVARPPEIAQGVVAKYSSEAKAKKAIEMLRKTYKASLWTETHYDNSAQANVSDLVMRNTVFQLPADEDMED